MNQAKPKQPDNTWPLAKTKLNPSALAARAALVWASKSRRIGRGSK